MRQQNSAIVGGGCPITFTFTITEFGNSAQIARYLLNCKKLLIHVGISNFETLCIFETFYNPHFETSDPKWISFHCQQYLQSRLILLRLV